MLTQEKFRYGQEMLFERSDDELDELDELEDLQENRWTNPLQEVNLSVIQHNLNQRVYVEDFQQQPEPNKPALHNLHKFLLELDENHDSQDEGIEDYKIGGYHPVHIGENLLNRYVIIQKLGWGHFSTVWLCKDFKYDTYVAIKIQKSSPHYMEAAFDQVQILQKAQKHHKDPRWSGKTRDDTHVVSMLNSFIHKTHYGNHFCMVFEILRCNLLDILKRYSYQGVPMETCQEICKQVLIGLDYLHRICGVIHTDLKPENVMVCLSPEEIQDIVDNGQLTKNQLFAERTQTFQKLLGIQVKPKSIQQKASQPIIKNETVILPNMEGLTKTQKKNLKKKLKKKVKKEKENNSTEPANIRAVPQKQQPQIPKTLDELFDMKKGKIVFNRGEKLKMPFKVKIADLGNACWKHHHFSTEIQTRQYRSPQVILGQTYNQSSDIWSLACMMYEMLTGDLLFQPRKGAVWGKNDDHLAQIQELLGPFDPNFALRGKKSKKYFNKEGILKRVPELQFWPIDVVLRLKHKIREFEAKEFCQFLSPMLIAQPERRISAQNALKMQWLTRQYKDYKLSESQYEALKIEFNEMQAEPKQPPRPENDIVASGQDNDGECQDTKQYRKGLDKKFADVRLIDRSFTDLGYIGYCDGICLEDLDSCANWQFSLADC